MGRMLKNPCKDCKDKEVDEYGYVCDLWCGKHSNYMLVKSTIKESNRILTSGFINFLMSAKMLNKSLDDVIEVLEDIYGQH